MAEDASCASCTSFFLQMDFSKGKMTKNADKSCCMTFSLD